MTATPQLQFGTYTFPPTFYVDKRPTNRDVPTQKLPRADGARIIPGYLSEKRFSLKGGLVGSVDILPTPGGDLRTQLDALKAACASGPANFTTSSDRYWRLCQVSTFEETYEPGGHGRYVDIALEIVTGDPFAYDTTVQTATQAIASSPAAWTVTGGGNTYALPVLQFTMSSTGTVDATLTNTTTGQALRLNGAVTSGDVIAVDCLLQTVTLVSTGADRIALFDGVFPSLINAANALTLTSASGSLSSVALAWNNRYL